MLQVHIPFLQQTIILQLTQQPVLLFLTSPTLQQLEEVVVYDVTGQAGANTITITTPGGATTFSAAGTSATTKTLTTAFSSFNIVATSATNYSCQKIT